MIRQIRERRLDGLCTVGIGIEGMDIPGLFGLLWLRRTLSLPIYLQFIGRCLRPMEGKTNGIILDPVGNLFIHGFPEAERAWSLAGSGDPRGQGDGEIDTSRQRICPFCGVANAAVNSVCHFCGRDLDSEEARSARQRRLPAMVDGKLVAVSSEGQQEEIRARAERIKLEQGEERREEERRREEPEEIGADGKARALRDGLFSVRRKMFADAVKNYL
jgi:superfamily II DNA or RNA helicase